MDAAAGSAFAVRGVHGVLAHQHKVHVAGREVNGDALIIMFPSFFDGGVLQG